MTETFIQHCITMYTALDDRAEIKTLESGGQARVFVGSYTEAFQATGLSRTYYTSTRRALEKNNAILIIQKGSRGADTVIVLQGIPETWDIEGWNDGQGKSLTNPPEYATLRADVDEIKKLVGGINVASALLEFQSRVEALEAEIAQIGQNGKSVIQTKSKTKENK